VGGRGIDARKYFGYSFEYSLALEARAMKIKLRRDWQGQDSWGAFVEEVAIDPDDLTLKYRQSTGGNCNYGQYKPWEGEARALEFLLGPTVVTPELRAHLFVALSKLPDLKEAEVNYGIY
jgi:hypothetical protein